MPMHFLGMAGMPRRIPDYPDAFTQWNVIASFGSIISIISTVIFIYNVYITLTREAKPLANNYWDVPSFFNSTYPTIKTTETATTLEWALPSPPAYHAYNTLPVQS